MLPSPPEVLNSFFLDYDANETEFLDDIVGTLNFKGFSVGNKSTFSNLLDTKTIVSHFFLIKFNCRKINVIEGVK